MKRVISIAFVTVIAVAVLAATSRFWLHGPDVRPEALATGGTLLFVASVLRRLHSDKRVR